MKTCLALSALLLSAAAQAHGGHGLPGASHWHASDTAGLLLVVVLGAAAFAFGRRK